VKHANEISESLLPKDEVKWAYEHIQGVLYVLHNLGTKTARNAVIVDIGEPAGFIRPDPEPADVPPGGAIEFRVLTAFNAPRPRFRVEWMEDGSEDEHHDDTTMIIRS
jgi:hypothetical protein